MSQKLIGARVNYKGKSKFGGMSLALKHEDFDGFVQVKDDSIDLSEVEKGSIVDVIISDKGKDKVVNKLRVTGKAEPRGNGGGGKGGGGSYGGGGYTESDKLEFRVKQAQTIALELTKFYVEKEVIKLGAKGKQAEQIEAEFDRLTAKIARSLDPAAVKALFATEAAVEAETVETEDEKPAKGKKPAEKQEDAFEADDAAEGDGFDDDFDSK